MGLPIFVAVRRVLAVERQKKRPPKRTPRRRLTIRPKYGCVSGVSRRLGPARFGARTGHRVFTLGSETGHGGFGLIGERDDPGGACRAVDGVSQCAAEVAASVGAVVSLDEH
jgi:hypothetical protein